MSAPRPVLDERVLAALDALEAPVSVTSAVRDRGGRLLDFRMEAVNQAAARWLGLERELIIGRLATELVPGLRSTGLFDVLETVVRTGRPFHERQRRYEGDLADGRPFEAVFDLAAVRVGDGYLSAWCEVADDVPASDVAAIAARAREAVPVMRLEARESKLRLRPAT